MSFFTNNTGQRETCPVVGGPVFGNTDWENEWSMVWQTSGSTATTYSGVPPTFVMPLDGWFYDGNYGGNDAAPRGIRLVTPISGLSSIEVDVYSPEDMHWAKSYTFVVTGSAGNYTEQSVFDSPPVPAGMLPVGTYTFTADISGIGALQKVELFYGQSDGAGDRAFVITDVRLA